MRTRTAFTQVALAGSLLALAGCSSDTRAGDLAAEPEAPTSSSSATTTPAEPDDPLAGTYRSGSLSLTKMTDVARKAGFKAPDIREYLSENFPGASRVVYSLKLVGGWWVVFNEIDDGSAEEAWSGPYHVVDGSTVVAGTPPCGPITYGYRLAGDVLSLDLQDDDCPGPDGTVPVGELIAQTIIYETDTFQRVG